MPISKIGASEKIIELARNTQEFEDLWKKASEENDLVRCCNCQKLLSKKISEGFTIKHKKLAAVIKRGQVQCPNCGAINNLGF